MDETPQKHLPSSNPAHCTTVSSVSSNTVLPRDCSLDSPLHLVSHQALQLKHIQVEKKKVISQMKPNKIKITVERSRMSWSEVVGDNTDVLCTDRITSSRSCAGWMDESACTKSQQWRKPGLLRVFKWELVSNVPICQRVQAKSIFPPNCLISALFHKKFTNTPLWNVHVVKCLEDLKISKQRKAQRASPGEPCWNHQIIIWRLLQTFLRFTSTTGVSPSCWLEASFGAGASK